MTVRIKKPNNRLLGLFLIIPALVVTLAAVTQPQRFVQFAKEMYTSPPLYGCLQVGEGNAQTCGTKLGKIINRSLTLHGKPLNKRTVYYGDRLYSSFVYKNVGDQPIQFQNIGALAVSVEKPFYAVLFQPILGSKTINPGETASSENTSYRFKSPDPNGKWTFDIKLRDKESGTASIDEEQSTFTVNATCTALRIKELTANDKSSIQSLCGKDPKNKLCTSRQYCEIFKGEGCTQPNVSQETPGWACDPGVYLPKAEQDILEALCKVYPDTDACKDFCDRTIGSSLCPDKYLFIDTSTGKPIRFNHPRVLYVRDPENLKFTYSKDYPRDKIKMTHGTGQAVQGIHTVPSYLAQAPIRSTGANGNSTAPGANVNQGGKCTPGAPGCPKSGVSTPVTASTPLILKKNAMTPSAQTGTSLQTGAPGAPKAPSCTAPLKPLKDGSCGICDGGDIQCEADRQQELTATCPQTTFSNPDQRYAWVPGVGCRGVPADKPPVNGDGAPPTCGLRPDKKDPCNLETNNLPPDPINGRILDPSTCNPDGTPKPGKTACTSLSIPETSQQGDIGYAPECTKTQRKDINPTDDPKGAPQHACCANALTLREGCCGQACEVWSEKVNAEGKIVEARNYFKTLCTNDPNNTNTCTRSREETIPKNLQGTTGANPPDGFLPGSKTSACDIQSTTQQCGDGLSCKATGTGPRSGTCEPNGTGAGGGGGGADKVCYDKKQWYDPEANSCVTAETDVPVKSIADGQDAQCGLCNNIAFLDSCKKPVSICCQNSCKSGSCHIPQTYGGVVYCGKAKPFLGPLQAEVDIHTAPDNLPTTPNVQQSNLGGEGALCDTRNPQTCQSGECLPSINETGGLCSKPKTGALPPALDNPMPADPKAPQYDPKITAGTLVNGSNCKQNSECKSKYCDAGSCQLPPNVCIAAGVSTRFASNCCSGITHNGVCSGPNIHPYDVPLGEDGYPK